MKMKRTKTITDYLTILHKIAWNFYNRNRALFEYEELFSEACLAYTKALPHYDCTQAKLTTFITISAMNHLTSYSMNKLKQEHHLQTIPIPDSDAREFTDRKSPDESIMFQSQMKSMHQYARQVCEMIMNDPDQFAVMNTGSLYAHLKTRGWKHAQITKSFEEIKTTLRA